MKKVVGGFPPSAITYHMRRSFDWVPAQALKVGMKVEGGRICGVEVGREAVRVRFEDGSFRSFPLHAEVRVIR